MLQARISGAIVLMAMAALAVTACSNGDDAASAPTLPPIATTVPAPTSVIVATTLPQFYEVQRGDTLFAIAAAYSIPVQAIIDANPEIASQDDIKAGQFLRIPPREEVVASVLPATVPGQSAPTMPGANPVTPTSTP